MYDAQAVQTLSSCLQRLNEGKGIEPLVATEGIELPKVINRLKQFDPLKMVYPSMKSFIWQMP